MIEGLARKRDRSRLACRAAALLREAAHHLYEAIEAATKRPRPSRAVGGEPADDQPGPKRRESRRGIAETAQRAGAIAVDDHVGGRDQPLEGVPIFRMPEIERGAVLAETAVDGDRRDLVETRRVDA